MCLSCLFYLDKSESLALQQAWQPSESSSWLPSQSALPTGRQLAHCCHFSTAPAIVTGDGRVEKQRGRSAGCQITPVSAARWDVKSAVDLSVSCRYVCRQRPWVIGDCFMHSFLWGCAPITEQPQHHIGLRNTCDNNKTVSKAMLE